MEETDREIGEMIQAIHRKYGYDFSQYSMPFVTRRIMNRLSLLGLDSVEELQRQVLGDPQLFETVLHDLSINMTEMFRDPSFYLALRREIIPYLKTYPFVKIWDAGCATGEEAYSLAILLLEEGLAKRARIYATDFNERSLLSAKKGVFPMRRMHQYAANYLKGGGAGKLADYFVEDADFAIVKSHIRENIVFSGHNLLADGVFNEMHLILCRNVLIYFDRNTQERVVRLFSDSLCNNGFLCLGFREKLRFSGCAEFFDPVPGVREMIYRKTERRDATPPLSVSPANLPFRARGECDAVVIGVSAGGMKALSAIVSKLAQDTPFPVIIVQHQSASHKSNLVQILGMNCRLKIKQAEEGEPVANGTIYLAPPSRHLLVRSDRTFGFSSAGPVNHACPSIDMLFVSAAEVYGKRVTGVILTGAGEDGSRGLGRIKESGGVVVVQDPSTADFRTMPQKAISLTAADHVLPLEEIGPFLAEQAKKAFETRSNGAE